MFWRRRTAARRVAADFGALETHVRALRDDLRALTKDVGAAAGDATAEASEARARVAKWARRNVDASRISVSRQPLAACLLSMTAGALFGATFLRR